MAPTTPAKPTGKSGAVETKKPDATVQSTANTTDVDKGAGGTVASEGNFSPKQVDGVSTPIKDGATAGATGPANAGAPALAPTDPNANTGLTAEQQAAIDAQKVKDANPDPTEEELDALDRSENGGKTLAELHAEEEEKERIANESDPAKVIEMAKAKVTKDDERKQRASMVKLARLVAVFDETTPDSHSIYGYGGVSVQLGDLRNIARAIERGTGITKDFSED